MINNTKNNKSPPMLADSDVAWISFTFLTAVFRTVLILLLISGICFIYDNIILAVSLPIAVEI